MRRVPLLPVAAGVLPLICVALIPLSDAHAASGASANNPFDAYIASGDASCLELTVNVAGFSFIVEPDARLPRATSSISEGESGALAAPADPGDSVDALAGLLVPREEGQIASGIDGGLAQTKIPFPVDVGNTLLTVASPLNPHLEYPIEHANAAYPDPRSSGDQEATYLGAPNASFSEPSGVLSVDGASGDAKAGDSYASAEAGAGAATSLPPLGISVGRVSSQASAVVSATAVSDTVSCTLHDVGIAPPGSGYSLHIGTLVASLQTQRTLTGSGATASHTVQLSDVTLDGKNLAPGGNGGLTLPPGVPSTVTFPQPPSCSSIVPPCPSLPVSLKAMSWGGTTHADSLGANRNEDTSTLTVATVTLQTTAPVPSSIPPTQNGNPVTSAPTTYTLQLGNLDSSAYGLPAVGFPVSNPAFGTLSGGALGGLGSYGSAGAAAGIPGTKPVASTVTIPGIAAAIRWPVVGLAAVLEAALLTSLLLRRRRAGRLPTDLTPSSFLDLP
jgi:hypothetical protein